MSKNLEETRPATKEKPFSWLQQLTDPCRFEVIDGHPCIHQRELSRASEKIARLEKKLAETKKKRDCGTPADGCSHEKELANAMKKLRQLEEELAEVKDHNEHLVKGGEKMLKCLEDGFGAVGIDLTTTTDSGEESRNWLEELSYDDKDNTLD